MNYKEKIKKLDTIINQHSCFGFFCLENSCPIYDYYSNNHDIIDRYCGSYDEIVFSAERIIDIYSLQLMLKNSYD